MNGAGDGAVEVSRRGRPAKRSPEEYRSLLVAAALEVIVESGVDGMTLAAVAKRADVAYGTLYRFFAGRDELLLRVFERLNDEVLETWQRRSSADPVERIVDVCLAPLRHVRQNPASKPVMSALVSDATDPQRSRGAASISRNAAHVARTVLTDAIEEARGLGRFEGVRTDVAVSAFIGLATLYRTIPTETMSDETWADVERSVVLAVRALAA